MSESGPGQAARRANRLIHETSSYLRQHAHNPVDWHPWDDQALHLARSLDRPIFLSIGYSACHWCHVMEHESFEDEAIARFMNEHFVNIKVDREERCDLDQIYMNAVQLLTRRGGWPMSVFLTPQLHPFYGGTYWPPSSRHGMPGFRDILEAVARAWRERREDVEHTANELTRAVQNVSSPSIERQPLDAQLLLSAARRLVAAADRQYGGFGGAPKFPHAIDLRVLMRAWRRFGFDDALAVARLTLDRMASGGLYDQLGGGFHRYSTDARWLVPHFEKMLYDNALLVPVYLDAYQITREPRYAEVARETLDYVLREMTDPQGGFYAAQDADSEGEEGRYFVWSVEEVERLLGPAEARLFCSYYDVTPGGNWEGQSILNRPRPLDQAAQNLNTESATLAQTLARARQTLFEARSQRVRPARDEKILAAWNGMMLQAMAQGAVVLGEERYRQATRRAAAFLLEHLRGPGGRLFHSFQQGAPRFNAYLDDYACLIDGLIDAYQAAFEPSCIEAAFSLAEIMIDLFADDAGGFFYTSRDHEPLIARQKETHDGSTPSGVATAALALLRLSRLGGRQDFEDRAVDTLAMLAGTLAHSPAAGGQALLAVDFWLGPAYEIAIVEGTDPAEHDALRVCLSRLFVPNKLLAFRPRGITEESLPAPLRPLLAGKQPRGESTTVYVCQKGACGLPVVGAEKLEAALTRR
jgi:hypothetical protein